VRHQHHHGQVLHLRVQLEPTLAVHLHLLFTLLGPALFWLAYPLGPFVALFRNRLDHTALTLTGAVIALVVGRR
jgi:hypothetical protein